MERARVFTAERVAVLENSDDENARLALFLHGFGGNYLKTWGSLLPLLDRHALQDETFRRWDYAFVGYSTHGLTSALDVVAALAQWIAAATAGQLPFTRRYSDFALFGHSLGALAIRQFLVADPCFQSTRAPVSRAAMIAEPSLGSHWADLTIRILGVNLFRVLTDLTFQSTFTRQLTQWAPCAANHHGMPACFSFHAQDETYIHIPANGPHQWPMTRASVVLPGTHKSVARARTLNDPLVGAVRMVLS